MSLNSSKSEPSLRAIGVLSQMPTDGINMDDAHCKSKHTLPPPLISCHPSPPLHQNNDCHTIKHNTDDYSTDDTLIESEPPVLTQNN